MLRQSFHGLKRLKLSRSAPRRSLFNVVDPRPVKSSQRHLTGALLLSSVVATVAGIHTYVKDPIHNEAPVNLEQPSPSQLNQLLSIFTTSGVEDDGQITSFAWGSNASNLLSPDKPASGTVPNVVNVPWLRGVALRDLALHKLHGVCVDARGDVYQWNDKSWPTNYTPVLTLRGKDIVSVQVTDTRLIALSSSGKIYVAPSNLAPEPKGISSSHGWYLLPFFSLTWLTGGSQPSNIIELNTADKFTRGEKFVSISAGEDHMLALTSSGRTFSYPLSKNANRHGQLGYRKFDIAGSSLAQRVPTELIPKSMTDPYANASRFSRIPSDEAVAEDNADESSVFCDRLFEVPSLKGIKIEQAVAGGRTSFVRTQGEGRVLAWGANEYGQLGLGATMTLDTISIPTEVVLSRSASALTRSRCVDITTGGDLTYLTVERQDGSGTPTIDLLACGNGQWGSLGNGLYSNAQGNPMKVKAVSGLVEFSETTQSLQAIRPHAISASPTGHVLLTLETLERSGPGGGGRDLLVWGLNRDYQLGNGKRTNMATPVNLEVAKGRLMLMKRRAEVHDLQGNKWKSKVEVEQRPIAGYGSSVVYWHIC